MPPLSLLAVALIVGFGVGFGRNRKLRTTEDWKKTNLVFYGEGVATQE